jgi:protein-S-isoprenylcysteine O-methyltransferase Ste14
MSIPGLSIVLVTLQFTLIGVILVTGPLVATRPVFFVVEILGALLGMWAIVAIGPRDVRVLPELSARARLITRGPYRRIRHPMYTSVLILTVALVGDTATPVRWAIWCVLVVVLVAKLFYEERLLLRRFPEYHDYRKRTWRLVPFVW